MHGAETQDDAGANAVDDLLDAILAHPVHEQEDALARACREHPEHAQTLRRRHGSLAVLGMLHDTGDDEQEPRDFGDFVLQHRIGSGGMGVVYKARQRSLDRDVAIKLLRPELAYFEQTRTRLRREADAIARLDHPGILPIHAVGEMHGIPFLVMPLLVGRPLADLLAGLLGRDPARVMAGDVARAFTGGEALATTPAWCHGDWTGIAVDLALQVAQALAHAHARGIVHRDVKPSNVMLTHDGRVLLLDFGLASAEHAPGITRSGTFMGSMAYASPEQLQGERVDARTDVFALGVLLYELLALQPPFAAATTRETVQRVLTHEPPALPRCNRRVGPDLAAIVRKAIEKAQSARYQTMAALAADLRAWRDAGPISVRPDTLLRRAHRWVRRQPLRAAAVGLSVATLLVGAGWVGYFAAVQGTVAIGRKKQAADAAEAEVLRGFVELAHGARAAAQAAFAKALAIDGSCAEARTGLWLLTARAQPSAIPADGAPPHALFQHAAWLLLSGAHGDRGPAKQATDLMAQAVARAPAARPLYHYKWLEAAGQAHDQTSVRTAAQAALVLWPASAFTHFWVGTAAMDHDPVRAEAALRQALAIDPTFHRAHAQLGSCLLHQGDAAGAATALAAAVGHEPDNGRTWIDLGIARERLNDRDGAVAALRTAVAVAPRLPGAHYNLGRLLELAGDVDGAVAAYERTLALEATYAQARQNLGLILIDRAQHEDAIAHFEQLVALRPELPDAHRCLGAASLHAGDAERALTAYREVTRLLPDDAEAHDVVCELLARRQDDAGLEAEKARWQARRKDGPP